MASISKVLTAQSRKEGQQQWRLFLQESSDAGAAIAHRLSKPQEVPAQAYVACDGGGSSCPQQLLDEQADEWETLWCTGAPQDPANSTWEQVQLLPRPDIAFVRTTCRKFKKFTSVVDGLSPRQVSYLSETALECFVSLMMSVEILGGSKWRSSPC